MTIASILGPAQRDINRAWDRFLSGATGETLSVRGPIIESWERCRASKIATQTPFAPHLSNASIEARRSSHGALLSASEKTLGDARNSLVGTSALMLITDPDGIVLDGAGDGSAVRAANDIALCRGGNWHETAVGTNGIGVAVATGRPTMVHGGEHYCEPMKRWSCAAAPIFDPYDQSVAGILNLSCLSELANNQLFALALFGARRIEREMQAHAERLRMRFLDIALGSGRGRQSSGLIAIDHAGRLVYASSHTDAVLRDRLNVRLASTTPGQRAFATSSRESPISPEVPLDWIEPIHMDGKVGGYILRIPERPSTMSHSRKSVAQSRRAFRRSSSPGFSAIVGDSAVLHAAIDRARRIAPSGVPILIEGETGVGKELFAQAVHDCSSQADGPFITLNCGAISRDLIGAELFGHVKGAYTGASAEGAPGRFELADGGTLCLDEIGELPLELQPYLLRVLEEGAVSRIGEASLRQVKVRVIGMTNRDLRSEVAAGRFRLDLYHRLAVLSVVVPPLRARHGDCELLIRHFLDELVERHGTGPIILTSALFNQLMHYEWPGNVRELRNVIEGAVLLSENGRAGIETLPEHLAKMNKVANNSSDKRVVRDEKARINEAISAASGNLSAACGLLGMSRSTLYRRLRELGLHRSA